MRGSTRKVGGGRQKGRDVVYARPAVTDWSLSWAPLASSTGWVRQRMRRPLLPSIVVGSAMLTANQKYLQPIVTV